MDVISAKQGFIEQKELFNDSFSLLSPGGPGKASFQAVKLVKMSADRGVRQTAEAVL